MKHTEKAQLTRENIIDFLKRNKSLLHQRFGVTFIALFGSYARGDANENSDIDILVDMPSSFSAFFGLKSYLEEHLGKTVDLGMRHKLRTFIRKEIKDEMIYV